MLDEDAGCFLALEGSALGEDGAVERGEPDDIRAVEDVGGADGAVAAEEGFEEGGELGVVMAGGGDVEGRAPGTERGVDSGADREVVGVVVEEGGEKSVDLVRGAEEAGVDGELEVEGDCLLELGRELEVFGETGRGGAWGVGACR